MSQPEIVSMLVFLAVFAVTGGAGFGVFFWLQRDRQRAIARLRSLGTEKGDAPEPASSTLGKVLPAAGQLLMPQEEELAGTWRRRLAQAGFRRANDLLIFLGIKLVLLLALPTAAILVPLSAGWLPLNLALTAGTIAVAVSMFGANYAIHALVQNRQRTLRRNLSDALDMLVLCLEGGVSLPAAIQRVTEELDAVFPVLAQEMNIVQREMQMGMAPGAAFQRFGDRCDLEEVRSLASILEQAERFGSGVAKSLRLHADSWRLERQQQAEERAQRASVLILFPMLICIFPVIFIVTLAPAVYQMSSLFTR